MAPYDPTGEMFADMARYARQQYFDALDRPLSRNDWLRTCAQAKEARQMMEMENGR